MTITYVWVYEYIKLSLSPLKILQYSLTWGIYWMRSAVAFSVMLEMIYVYVVHHTSHMWLRST